MSNILADILKVIVILFLEINFSGCPNVQSNALYENVPPLIPHTRSKSCLLCNPNAN